MTMATFNPEMLALARDLKGFTQGELAEQIHVSQGEMSKIEAGVREPSEDLVAQLAHSLDCVPDFFYLTDPIRFGSGCIYNRKKQSTSQKTLRQLFALVNKRRIEIRRLLQAVELPDNVFPRFDVEDYASPADIARKVRATWRLPPGPLGNLTRTIEDAWGLVVREDFRSPKVDALSQWLPGIPPMFFINESSPADRMRFSLAHELGHIVMHQIQTDDMEKEADRFAAEILMPEESIKPHLMEITLPKLAALKQHWRVSMNALLKRACDLGTITERTKNYLWFKMGSLGYKTVEPGPIAPEQPKILDEMIEIHTKELGYSVQDLARLMVAPEEAIRNRYIPQTGLHIVS
jgi:Zn-dependent peptidase ImmA (M78 family)/transcriptional regulator with XRE-family HTH domain